MKTKIEKLLKLYPEMVRERDCITNQLAHFRGVSAEEVIESMYTPRMDGERVQSSNLSDKTAQIALNYRERQQNINQDWYAHLEMRLQLLNDEIVFLKSALQSLPGELSQIMWDMVVEEQKWSTIEEKYNISHSALYRLRKKAIQQLATLYETHDTAVKTYMLQ